MTRVLVTAVALAGLMGNSRAGEKVVQLHLLPMAAPKPALKYLLLPELGELNPGNPAHGYLRSFAEQNNFFFGKEATAQRLRYLSIPLAELAKEKLSRYGGNALSQADWAARLDTLDWGLLQRVRTSGAEPPAGELGRLNILGAALQVRLRSEVASRQFDDALRTAKTMLAFARHLGEYPTEAGNLLGLTIALRACDTLEEMVQQPGAPNLYWALTDLPCPLVELRKGFQGERTLMTAELRPLRGDAPMTEEQLEKVVGRLSGEVGFIREQAGQPPRSVRAELAARVNDSAGLAAARDHLIQAGCKKDLAMRLPALQVVLLDEKWAYEMLRDESMKLLAISPWQIETLPDVEKLQPVRNGILTDFVPKVLHARRALGRLEQRIGILRQIEALRLVAAENGGVLPQNLTEIQIPLPLDPFTGRPFLYKADGMRAHLEGGIPAGEEQNPCFQARYEITMAK